MHYDPAVSARCEEAGSRVVEAADQPTEVREGELGHGPGGIGWQRDLALDERDDLATFVVYPEMARRTVEADRLEVAQQRPDALAGRTGGPMHGIADANRRVPRVHAADQWDLAHGNHGDGPSSRLVCRRP